MARRTLTAVFDNESDALRAQEALVAHGIPRADATLHRHASGRSEEDKGFLESLAELFLPEEDHRSHAEALSRGGTVLSVRLAEDRWEEAADIMEANGAVDMEEREASWRSEGWDGGPSSARADYMSGMPDRMGTRAGATGTTLDQPDGTPGNPPGTMLSRGLDEVLGTNMSGAYPENEMAAHHARAEDARLRGRDTATGTAARATGVSGVAPHDPATAGDTARGVDEALGTNLEGRPDGTPGNPPGTMLSRGMDDALGTNVSGARPENEAPRSIRRDAAMGRRRVRSYLWDDAGTEARGPKVSGDALADRDYEASESREESEEARIARMARARDEARNRM